ncbi:MAG: alpha/beta hydrolase [Halieaceae bacterium]|jgi:pimeloyl-ACP methyl ester carboxylesterase|nr:alpha/beta hydrolase [Halieaceae bacterium]
MAFMDREAGRRVYYENYGAGSDAVVLIHGWGMGLRAWDYSLQALLAAGHRVVALDHRGCGESDKDFEDVSISAIASDVVALVEHLGLARVVLNGWSLGGAVAVEAASALAQRCCGLVLTCGATPAYLQKSDFPHGGTDADLAGTLAAMAADRVNFLAALAQGVCAVEVSQQVQDWLWQMFMRSSPLAARTLAELGPLDQRDMLGAIGVPVLSFVGARDAVVDPAICRSVTSYNSGARIVEFEEAGHAPFIEEPERYNREFASFLSECF